MEFQNYSSNPQVGKKRERGERNRGNQQKTNNNLAESSSYISIITLSVNG